MLFMDNIWVVKDKKMYKGMTKTNFRTVIILVEKEKKGKMG